MIIVKITILDTKTIEGPDQTILCHQELLHDRTTADTIN